MSWQAPVPSSLCPHFGAPTKGGGNSNGVPFVGGYRAKVSVYADDFTAFVSRLLNIEAVKKVIVGYQEIVGAKRNFVKSENLWLCA